MQPNSRSKRFRIALAAAFLTGACASATKRLEQGQELEQQGRTLDAAHRYVDALKKDRTLTEARGRLLETGTRAVAELLSRATALDASGSAMEAAETLRSADELIRDAVGVDVTLPLPRDYAQARERTLDRAVEQALAAASAATQRRDFSRAVELVQQARERWEPGVAKQIALGRALREAQLSWGENDLVAGHYRDAFAHADAAAQVAGYSRADVERLQDEALRRGTIPVAMFPAGARRGNDDHMLPELNDLLALNHWQRPPQWIAVTNLIEAQRAVRIRGLAGRELDAQDAGAMARQLGARYAVAATLDSIRSTESGIKRQRRSVKTRAGADTAFYVEEGELETWARVGWRIIDAAGGRSVIDRGDATAKASSTVRRASYAGNWRDLELGNADRTLFERDGRENQDALRKIARTISDRVGVDVYQALLRRVE